MSWIDKAHRDNKIKKEIDRAMRSPRYQVEEKKKLEEVYQNAFNNFLLISADFLHRHCGFGKKRMLKYIDFVVYQMHCIETDPEYFRLLNGALEEETGVNFLGELENAGRTNEGTENVP